MTVREYIGARYVPLFIGVWDKTKTYEPLSIVSYEGNSYTSRQYVPMGIELTDESYWAITGNYNAQVEAYRQEVIRLQEQYQNFGVKIQDEATARENADTVLRQSIQDEATARENADTILRQSIQDEATARENADTILRQKINDFKITTFSQPNFRCVDRLIYSDWGANGVTDAQACCVFIQDGIRYWAQTINSQTEGQDRLLIRNIDTNTTVANMTTDFGHGYTISYNETRKLLMLENDETKTIMYISVETISNPFVVSQSQMSNIILDNPCWYDADNIVGFNGDKLTVTDMSVQTIVKEITYDLKGYSSTKGYLFQNICYFADAKQFYIGVTAPDGFIVLDYDNENETAEMVNFYETKQYYGCIYMRELESAYRCEDKIYINNYEEVDGLFVPCLLEWDVVHGTIPEENSKYIQHTGNLGTIVNYNTGSLIQNESGSVPFKLFGDAVKYGSQTVGHGRIFVVMQSDYPHIMRVNGQKVGIQNLTGVVQTYGGFDFVSSNVYISNPDLMRIMPDNIANIGGNHVAMRVSVCDFFYINGNTFPTMVNPNNISDAIAIYIEMSNVIIPQVSVAPPNDTRFRWSNVTCRKAIPANTNNQLTAFNYVD